MPGREGVAARAILQHIAGSAGGGGREALARRARAAAAAAERPHSSGKIVSECRCDACGQHTEQEHRPHYPRTLERPLDHWPLSLEHVLFQPVFIIDTSCCCLFTKSFHLPLQVEHVL